MPKKSGDQNQDKPVSQTGGRPAKEQEPVGHLEEVIEAKHQAEKKEIEEVSHYLRQAEDQIKVSQDLEDLGVTTPEKIEKDTLGPVEALVIPISEEGIKSGLRKKVESAWRWLAEWAVRILKIARLHHLKVIFGRSPQETGNRKLTNTGDKQ